jgi:hypothetical protein
MLISRNKNIFFFHKDRIRYTVVENRVAPTPDDNLDISMSVAWSTAADSNNLRVGGTSHLKGQECEKGNTHYALYIYTENDNWDCYNSQSK